MLKSRPLVPLDSLATDGIAPLTPGQFLIGGIAITPGSDFILFTSTMESGSTFN